MKKWRIKEFKLPKLMQIINGGTRIVLFKSRIYACSHFLNKWTFGGYPIIITLLKFWKKKYIDSLTFFILRTLGGSFTSQATIGWWLLWEGTWPWVRHLSSEKGHSWRGLGAERCQLTTFPAGREISSSVLKEGSGRWSPGSWYLLWYVIQKKEEGNI